MKRGLRLTNKKRKNTEQAPPPPPKLTRTSRYTQVPQVVPAEEPEEPGERDELDEAATGWQQTTVKMAGLTRMITVGVWLLVLAGPLLAFFAVVLAGSSRATTASGQAQGTNRSAASATGPSGFAELYVAAYLAAGEGTEDELLPYYAEPVAFANKPGSRSASHVVTVAAEQVEKGYWSVTVAARVSAKDKAGKMTDRGMHYYRVGVQVSGTPEAGGALDPSKTPGTPPPGAARSSAAAQSPTAQSPAAQSPAAQPSPAPSGSASAPAPKGPPALYAATSLPAEVNAPPTASSGGLAYGSDASRDKEVSDTVSRFLAAYLTGEGELNRYVSPGLQVAAIVPAPYESTLVTAIQDDAPDEADEDTVPADGTRRQVLASVSATTGGQDYLLSYALTLTTRAGRWEVASFDTAPALAPDRTGPVAASRPAPHTSADGT